MLSLKTISLLWLIALTAPTLGVGQTPDLPPEWNLAPEADLVLGEGSDLAELFQSVTQVISSEDGGVFVADAGLHTVRFFDAAGELVWTVGGEGEGPGEFLTIHGMWLTSDNRLGVWDGRLDRLTFISLDGLNVEVEALDGSGNLNAFIGVFPDGGVLLGSLSFGRSTEGAADTPMPDQWTVGVFDQTGAVGPSLMTLKGMRRLKRNPIAFSAMPMVVTHGDSILTLDDGGQEISVRDRRGGVSRLLTVDLGAAEGETADLVGALRRELEAKGKTLYLEYLDTMGDAIADVESVPAIGGILLDSEGLLWVKPYGKPADSIWLRGVAQRPAGGGIWRVFRLNGDAVASVAMPATFTPLQVSAELLVGVSVDPLGVERVTSYRLRR